ncbi:MAG: flagellar protein FlgN [Lachnospiraceae bacterium]|nr:flagellar protein FlgN [Lachnospiraceae bacterium]
MASLIEDLIDTLNKETDEYGKLLELSRRKATVIVARDIPALEKITDDEQTVVSNISNLDAKRAQVTSDIADVINKDVESLKLSVLIDLLSKQPKEQKALSDVHDRLKVTVDNVRKINESNRQLIEQSLEMVEFDLNMMRAMRQAPETNNYGRGAVSVGETLGSVRGFDAKQ